ncbi:MAG TPA: NAD(P)/FAD-dependent oxidoreductase [Anaerolineales bacterium]|nr:NAD(P)/FAD-dependent oxidoreductase [Anaerolineales bacterium]
MQGHDILILGGGPSGLSTALHIAKDFPELAPRILILEKAHYPRPKVCAGGLVIDAEVILQRLGLDVSEVPHVDAERIHFDFEARGLKIRIPRRHALRVIRRDEFDNWLAKKAETRGLEIREGVAVKNVIPHQHHIIVETNRGNFRAQVVVGADGSNGVTRRFVFPNAPVHTARVLEVLTPIQEQCELNEQRENIAFFDFFPILSNIAGYVWDFPTRVNGESMRCWGIYDTNILAGEKRPQLKEPLAKEMSRLGFDLNRYEIQGHPIRWFSPWNQMSVPRVLLVGDSAGADPFLGEGISMALGYGALAAREIGEAFRQGDFSFNGYRRRVLKSALGQALIARWLLAHTIYMFRWKWFQILVWRVIKPTVTLVAWLFVINWARRLNS